MEFIADNIALLNTQWQMLLEHWHIYTGWVVILLGIRYFFKW